MSKEKMKVVILTSISEYSALLEKPTLEADLYILERDNIVLKSRNINYKEDDRLNLEAMAYLIKNAKLHTADMQPINGDLIMLHISEAQLEEYKRERDAIPTIYQLKYDITLDIERFEKARKLVDKVAIGNTIVKGSNDQYNNNQTENDTEISDTLIDFMKNICYTITWSGTMQNAYIKIPRK